MMSRAYNRVLIVSVVPLAAAFCYLASPYVALYHLSRALQTSDCKTLRVAIDWTRVRASLQDEITGGAGAQTAKAGIAVAKPAAATSDDLPDFGDSFATVATGNALSSDLTPESVAALVRDHPVTMVDTGGSMLAEARELVAWAFFSGPRSFEVWFRADQDPHELPVRLQLAFTRQHGWRVVGVWVPQDLLSAGDATHST